MPKIYLDTGDLEEILNMRKTGIIRGVTTNPVLIRKYLDSKNIQFNDYIPRLLEATKGIQTFIQPVADNINQFVSEAKRLMEKYGEGGDIVIKVPLRIYGQERGQYWDGLSAINELSKEKFKVNASAIMSPEQAVLASIAGATYFAIFTGNVDDFIRQQAKREFEKDDYYGKNVAFEKESDEGISCGEDLVDKTINLSRKLGLDSKIVIAGVRNRQAFREYLTKDVEILTVPTRVFTDILSHPKTLEFGKDCYSSKSWFENER